MANNEPKSFGGAMCRVAGRASHPKYDELLSDCCQSNAVPGSIVEGDGKYSAICKECYEKGNFTDAHQRAMDNHFMPEWALPAPKFYSN